MFLIISQRNSTNCFCCKCVSNTFKTYNESSYHKETSLKMHDTNNITIRPKMLGRGPISKMFLDIPRRFERCVCPMGIGTAPDKRGLLLRKNESEKSN